MGDAPERVARNRALLAERLALPAEPLWLRQVHGCGVAIGGTDALGCEADAALARAPGTVCAVMTADCLPLLLCDARGSAVAAVHAGWRGLVNGVVEAALAALGCDPSRLLAWLGPAIGPDAFEVGPEVRAAFLAADPGVGHAFARRAGDRWLADIYALAGSRLAAAGVARVYGGDHCTYAETQHFFSFRRDGVTGRMASLVWIDAD